METLTIFDLFNPLFSFSSFFLPSLLFLLLFFYSLAPIGGGEAPFAASPGYAPDRYVFIRDWIPMTRVISVKRFGTMFAL